MKEPSVFSLMSREILALLNLEYPKPNKESLDSIRETEEITAAEGSSYATADEMFAAMENNVTGSVERL